jgi:2-beta-glucuronyltransferase
VTFHVIGSKQKHDFPTNVVQYDEMPFLETTKYVMNATIGIAPYRAIEGGEYLADSSMKMRQFGYAGLPAVCSNFAAGDVPRRFGYDPLKPETMIAATAAALEAGKVKEPIDCLDWSQIAGLIFDVPQPD